MSERRRFLRTFNLSPATWVTLVMGLLVLAMLGATGFSALGLNPLGGALMLPCGALLGLSVVDRVRWGRQRSQHLVTFEEREATDAELRRIVNELSGRGVEAALEHDEHGRPVLGYRNSDQRSVIPVLVSHGASTPRSGW